MGGKLIQERSIKLELRWDFLTVRTINQGNNLPPKIVGAPHKGRRGRGFKKKLDSSNERKKNIAVVN